MLKILYKEHLLKVPLDHKQPKKGFLHVFAREAYCKGNEKADIFVYLQGGPGFASPRVTNSLPILTTILKRYRILLLDQRGTGLSTKIGPETVENKSVSELTEYFSFFRADQIVYDLEYLREKTFKVKKWFLLAQSYGGFITFTYLSLFQKSIKGALVFGGVPPLANTNVYDIYDSLTDFIIQRNNEYYKKYPKDIKAVAKIVEILIEKPYKLPDNSFLTAQRFLDIGMSLGSTNGLDVLHRILEDPYTDVTKSRLSFWFVKQIIDRTSFETNPIYAVLHESIYCNGFSSNWACDQNLKKKTQFQLQKAPYYFYGETIRKSMFLDYKMLRPYRLIAEKLAYKKDWPELYNMQALSENTVPVEAIAYKPDYYVNHALVKNAIKCTKNINVWHHPTFQHDAIRTHGLIILPKLLKQLENRITQ